MKKSLGFILGTISSLSAVSVVFAQTIKLTPPQNIPSSVPLENIPQFIITLLFVVGLVIALAFLIYGGIKWILSGGDKAAVDAARKHIVAAIIGLVIVAGAYIILNIVFKLVFGSTFDIQKLCIPSLTNTTCP